MGQKNQEIGTLSCFQPLCDVYIYIYIDYIDREMDRMDRECHVFLLEGILAFSVLRRKTYAYKQVVVLISMSWLHASPGNLLPFA